jgi:hypothetical protein
MLPDLLVADAASLAALRVLKNLFQPLNRRGRLFYGFDLPGGALIIPL